MMYQKINWAISCVSAFCCMMCATSSAAETNEVKDLRLNGAFETHVAYSDGRHNAFSGAASWKNEAYIVFRNAEHHVSYDGAIKVISTRDGKEFQERATISQKGKDLRDPKIVSVGDQLFIYTGAVDESDTKRLSTEAKLFISRDGNQWTERKVRGLHPSSWLWFVDYDGTNFYGSAYCRQLGEEWARATLYQSKDGMNWEPFFSVPEDQSNEVALDRDSSNGLYALIRQEKAPYHPIFLSIANLEKPGLFRWKPLPFSMQGPFLKRMKDGCILLGRRWDDPAGKDNFFPNPDANRRVEMIWLGDDDKIERLCTLPSGGDCSYAGWAELADGRILISYYSGHGEKYPKANIYAAIFSPDQLSQAK